MMRRWPQTDGDSLDFGHQRLPLVIAQEDLPRKILFPHKPGAGNSFAQQSEGRASGRFHSHHCSPHSPEEAGPGLASAASRDPSQFLWDLEGLGAPGLVGK